MTHAGWAAQEAGDDECFHCGSTTETPEGQGCWWCEPEHHPEPPEIATYKQMPEQEAKMIADGILYITTKLAEERLLREGQKTVGNS